MMNSAPAVVGASDGLAAFRSIIAKRGPALLGRGGRRCGSARVEPTTDCNSQRCPYLLCSRAPLNSPGALFGCRSRLRT